MCRRPHANRLIHTKPLPPRYTHFSAYLIKNVVCFNSRHTRQGSIPVEIIVDGSGLLCYVTQNGKGELRDRCEIALEPGRDDNLLHPIFPFKRLMEHPDRLVVVVSYLFYN